jgi:antitoxin HigA-1
MKSGKKDRVAPIHPGETLREDVLQPLGLSVNGLAKALGANATKINDIVRGRRGITADTALRLARYLDTTPDFWMGLQTEYQLRLARRHKLARIEREVRPRSEVA